MAEAPKALRPFVFCGVCARCVRGFRVRAAAGEAPARNEIAVLEDQITIGNGWRPPNTTNRRGRRLLPSKRLGRKAAQTALTQNQLKKLPPTSPPSRAPGGEACACCLPSRAPASPRVRGQQSRGRNLPSVPRVSPSTLSAPQTARITSSVQAARPNSSRMRANSVERSPCNVTWASVRCHRRFRKARAAESAPPRSYLGEPDRTRRSPSIKAETTFVSSTYFAAVIGRADPCAFDARGWQRSSLLRSPRSSDRISEQIEETWRPLFPLAELLLERSYDEAVAAQFERPSRRSTASSSDFGM